MTRLPAALLLLLAATLLPGRGQAQSLTLQSVDSAAPALGNVTSAPSGATVFEVSPSSGTVTRTSGSGYRIGQGNTRALVTLACNDDERCATEAVTVELSAVGSTTGRAGSLSGLRLAGGTATVTDGPIDGSAVRYVLAPIGRNATATFFVGATVTILGNDSDRPTGLASASFQVKASLGTDASDMKSGAVTATVLRPLAVAPTADLRFGTLLRANGGSGTVSIAADDDQRHVSGTGLEPVGGGAGRARFTISGEGGQVFSLAVPDHFTMDGPGGSAISVTTAPSISGTQRLDGTLGNGASATLSVGGAITVTDATPYGSYSGTFMVTVQYE
jgi:hypothetical protein